MVTPACPEQDDSDLVGITLLPPLRRTRTIWPGAIGRAGRWWFSEGPHATLVPGEALKHADAVVLGEADETWPKCIEDAARGKLSPLYRAERSPDPAIIPRSRHDLVSRSVFMRRSLQASRGCPFSCEYCSLPGFYGKGYRTRPVRAVVEEIASMDWKRGDPPIVLWDDNIVGNHRWAKKLFSELSALKVQWLSQATITMAEDAELTRLAGESGCVGIFCGLESFSEASLAGVGKAFNRVRDYKVKVQRLHDHGIAITAGMVFGFDEDDPDIFARSVEAAQDIALDGASVGVLVPFPGTPLYDQMNREGRILTRDWSLYDGEHVVIRPRRMTPEQLDIGMRVARREFYSLQFIAKRMWRSRTRPHVVGPDESNVLFHCPERHRAIGYTEDRSRANPRRSSRRPYVVAGLRRVAVSFIASKRA